MSPVENNPPAFPSQPRDAGGLPCGEHQYGMTLHDWFAGHAPAIPDLFTIPMPDMSGLDGEGLAYAWSDWNVRRAVAWTTAYADAMISWREPKP